jgi:hypothetical protein
VNACKIILTIYNQIILTPFPRQLSEEEKMHDYFVQDNATVHRKFIIDGTGRSIPAKS